MRFYLKNLKNILTKNVKTGNIYHIDSYRFYSKSKFPKKR